MKNEIRWQLLFWCKVTTLVFNQTFNKLVFTNLPTRKYFTHKLTLKNFQKEYNHPEVRVATIVTYVGNGAKLLTWWDVKTSNLRFYRKLSNIPNYSVTKYLPLILIQLSHHKLLARDRLTITFSGFVIVCKMSTYSVWKPQRLERPYGTLSHYYMYNGKLILI